MKTRLSKIALVVSITLALAFTLSCSSHDEGNDPVSNSSVTQSSSSSAINSSSSGGTKEVISTSVVQITTYNAGNINGVTISRYEYEYDSRGNKTKLLTYDNNGGILSIAEYDIRGQVYKVTYYADGRINAYEEYEYDSRGQPYKIVTYKAADGSIISSYEYENEYDSRGNLTKTGVTANISNSNTRLEYEYDSRGNQTKMVFYRADGSVSLRYEYENEYDSRDNMTKQVSYVSYGNGGSGGSISSSITEIEYDNRGNQTKKVIYNDDGSIIQEVIWTYTYIKL
jgi:hypothetical protein